jgi:hypothetical protein
MSKRQTIEEAAQQAAQDRADLDIDVDAQQMTQSAELAEAPIVQEPVLAEVPVGPMDDVQKAIFAVQQEPGYQHTSAEHLEVRAVRKLVEGGYDEVTAERYVRARLY